MQLEKLTASFQCVTEDLRRQFMVDGEPLLHENSIGSSPILASSFRRTTGFNIPDRNQLSSSGQKTPTSQTLAFNELGIRLSLRARRLSAGMLSQHQCFSAFPLNRW